MDMQRAAMAELARRELARRKEAISGTPNIIEEMHDGISVADRAIVKNFSQSPEKSANYIKKHNPELDTRVWDGRVLVKGKTEKDWRVLDPDADGFDGLGEFAMDAIDVAYDVGSGVAEGAVGLLTGIGTANPVVGVAGSAATSAAAEGLRQAIGGVAGIDNDAVEAGKDVLLMGALGGAVPGVGKAVTPALKAATKGAKKYAPSVLGRIGNQSAEEIDTYMKHAGDVRLMERDGITPYVGGVKESVEDAILAEKKASGELTNDVISGIGEVDIAEGIKPALDRIQELQKIFEAVPNPANKANLDDVVEAYNRNFGVYEIDPKTGELILSQTEELSTKMDAVDAWKAQQEMRADSKTFNRRSSGLIDRHNKSSSVADKLTADAFAESERGINKVLSDASGGESSIAKRRYQMNEEIREEIAPLFKTKKATEATLRTLAQPNNKIKRELLDYLDKNYGTGVIKAANKTKAFDTFGSQAKGVTGLDTANITKQTPLSAMLGGLGGVVGWSSGSGFGAMAGAAAGQALGKKLSSPAAIRKYIDTIVRQDKYMKVLDKKTKAYMKEQLYKRITKGAALRELIKTSGKMNKDRG